MRWAISSKAMHLASRRSTRFCKSLGWQNGCRKGTTTESLREVASNEDPTASFETGDYGCVGRPGVTMAGEGARSLKCQATVAMTPKTTMAASKPKWRFCQRGVSGMGLDFEGSCG